MRRLTTLLTAAAVACIFISAGRAVPADEAVPRLNVTVDHVSTGKPYRMVAAQIGAKTCIDREFQIRELSKALDGGLLLQTSNDDDFNTAAEHVRLKLSGPATIYVCYDGRSRTVPAWLRGWELTKEKMVTTDVTSRVYAKRFPAGDVTLGANEREATGGLSHYFAIIVSGPNVPPREKIDVRFARDVGPLFKKRCYACHGPDLHEGGLRLDVRRRALLGGDSGTAIKPGLPAASELVQRVTHEEAERRMPPDEEPLTPQEIKLLRAWIEQGAEWPDELAGKEDYGDHWSFRPLERPAVPVVNRSEQVRNPIDAFILARLEPSGVGLAAQADRHTLIRRLYLDLVGLPPSPESVAEFVADDGEEAYAALVDGLLDSPHFGERWGRHWLDLARFAESDGYENDRLRPGAWHFRDWVIDAVNRDMPFDRFTIEQLAGDLLPEATAAQQVATAFHRNTLWNSAASADKEEFRIRAVKDRAETTATVWLGLTLACAQCHSHKYDPIAQREYYSFYAFFNAAGEHDVPIDGGAAPAMRKEERTSYVHLRGDFLNRGDEVGPQAPLFLPELTAREDVPVPDRLDLARWIVDRRNPLTARVAVNRFWQHLFGRGLVATPENFGRNGEPPSHPKLLDWLADEFVAGGWSRKRLIRTIVISSAYRQSSRVRGELAESDHPLSEVETGLLLGRQNRFRVEAEIVRDAALSVSGLLNDKMGGPSIVPPFPDGLLSHRLTQEVLKQPGGDRHRRGVYVHVQRTLTHPSLAAFDVADGNAVCVRRDRSITPVQALTLLNDPVFVECVQALGKRLHESAETDAERLRHAFLLCLSREATAAELAVLERLLQQQREQPVGETEVWQGVARTLINIDEFTTRD